MARKKPITQRWPGKWVFRGKVWGPERDALEYYGYLGDPKDPLGPLIKTLLVIAFTRDTFMTRTMKRILKDALAKTTAEMVRVNKRKKK